MGSSSPIFGVKIPKKHLSCHHLVFQCFWWTSRIGFTHPSPRMRGGRIPRDHQGLNRTSLKLGKFDHPATPSWSMDSMSIQLLGTHLFWGEGFWGWSIRWRFMGGRVRVGVFTATSLELQWRYQTVDKCNQNGGGLKSWNSCGCELIPNNWSTPQSPSFNQAVLKSSIQFSNMKYI